MVFLLMVIWERNVSSFIFLWKRKRGSCGARGTWQKTLEEAEWGSRYQRISWLLEGRCQLSRGKMSIVKNTSKTLFASLDFSRVFVAATLTTVTTAENPAYDAAPENEFSFWPAFLTQLASLYWLMKRIHFVLYTNIKSLCCTPETHIVLYANYISIKMSP